MININVDPYIYDFVLPIGEGDCNYTWDGIGPDDGIWSMSANVGNYFQNRLWLLSNQYIDFNSPTDYYVDYYYFVFKHK